MLKNILRGLVILKLMSRPRMPTIESIISLWHITAVHTVYYHKVTLNHADIKENLNVVYPF